MKRKTIFIPYCEKHNKFQTENGRWLDAREDLLKYIAHKQSKNYDIVLKKEHCNECEIEFNLPRFKWF